jgi:hypothetical protein
MRGIASTIQPAEMALGSYFRAKNTRLRAKFLSKIKGRFSAQKFGRSTSSAVIDAPTISPSFRARGGNPAMRGRLMTRITPAALARWRRDPIVFVREALIDPETGQPFERHKVRDGAERYLQVLFLWTGNSSLGGILALAAEDGTSASE